MRFKLNMQITINPIALQNNNYNPRFKAKKVNVPKEIQEKAFETLAAGSAVLGSVLVTLNQKIKETQSEEDIAIHLCFRSVPCFSTNLTVVICIYCWHTATGSDD